MEPSNVKDVFISDINADVHSTFYLGTTQPHNITQHYTNLIPGNYLTQTITNEKARNNFKHNSELLAHFLTHKSRTVFHHAL
jgi:hypothetical protein